MILSPISFPLLGGDCTVTFTKNWQDGRLITYCAIRAPKMMAAGVAFCHPKDSHKDLIGYKLAFRRAIEQLYPVIILPEFDTVPDNVFEDAFRKQHSNKETRAIIWKFFLDSIKEYVDANT